MNSYCGFLEKKSFFYLPSTSSWTLYCDETEQTIVEQYPIDDSFIVQVIPPEHGREFIFEIKYNINQTLMILSCPNISIIESWIISLLQIINGTIRDSENFDVGKRSNSFNKIFSPLYQPLHDHPIITSIYQLQSSSSHLLESSTSSSNETIPKLPSRRNFLLGKFMKRSLHKNSWKERWVLLFHQELTIFPIEEEINMSILKKEFDSHQVRHHRRGTRQIFLGSKIALLPCGYEGQRYSFAFITYSPLATLVTLRLSCESLEQLQEWIESLKIEILHLLYDRVRMMMRTTRNERNGEGIHETSRVRDGEEEVLDQMNENDDDEMGIDYETVIRHTFANATIASSPPPHTPLPMALKRSNSSSKLSINSMFRLFSSPSSATPLSHLPPSTIVLNYFTSPISLPPSVVATLPPHLTTHDSQFLLVSVFENQRFIPLTGWRSSYLLPFTDYSTYTNLVGIKYPFTHLNRSLPPTGCQWLFPLLQQNNSTKTKTKDKEKDRRNEKMNKFKHKLFSSSSFSSKDKDKDKEITADVEENHEEKNEIREDESHSTGDDETKDASLTPSPPPSPSPSPVRVKGLNGFEVDDEYTTTDQAGWVYAATFERFSLHLSENSSHAFRKGRDLVRRRKWIRIARITPSTSQSSSSPGHG